VAGPLLDEIRRIDDVCPTSADQFLEFVMARFTQPNGLLFFLATVRFLFIILMIVVLFVLNFRIFECL
jgi:hypothetical protein